jgi:hypothetical protein
MHLLISGGIAENLTVGVVACVSCVLSPTSAMANRVFLESSFQALTAEGIWVGRVDAIATVQSPEIGKFARLMRRLERAGFESLLDYSVLDKSVANNAGSTKRMVKPKSTWPWPRAWFPASLTICRFILTAPP